MKKMSKESQISLTIYQRFESSDEFDLINDDEDEGIMEINDSLEERI